eukprot:CAMPEP_0185534640 /NCGR_PEP_ID=MMETSP1366-20130426/109048_1 /TAXON_ID=38817 /ORGANISM="Gephyrocapsa oceanica, Strain RCC1303" /LENGTH=427 /DNA_ID=CAMNT_0028146363 /DNA_START=209 /DNA_END=1492 /DNA_ORIENTATION=-
MPRSVSNSIVISLASEVDGRSAATARVSGGSLACAKARSPASSEDGDSSEKLPPVRPPPPPTARPPTAPLCASRLQTCTVPVERKKGPVTTLASRAGLRKRAPSPDEETAQSIAELESSAAAACEAPDGTVPDEETAQSIAELESSAAAAWRAITLRLLKPGYRHRSSRAAPDLRRRRRRARARCCAVVGQEAGGEGEVVDGGGDGSSAEGVEQLALREGVHRDGGALLRGGRDTRAARGDGEGGEGRLARVQRREGVQLQRLTKTIQPLESRSERREGVQLRRVEEEDLAGRGGGQHGVAAADGDAHVREPETVRRLCDVVDNVFFDAAVAKGVRRGSRLEGVQQLHRRELKDVRPSLEHDQQPRGIHPYAQHGRRKVQLADGGVCPRVEHHEPPRRLSWAGAGADQCDERRGVEELDHADSTLGA